MAHLDLFGGCPHPFPHLIPSLVIGTVQLELLSSDLCQIDKFAAL